MRHPGRIHNRIRSDLPPDLPAERAATPARFSWPLVIDVFLEYDDKELLMALGCLCRPFRERTRAALFRSIHIDVCPTQESKSRDLTYLSRLLSKRWRNVRSIGDWIDFLRKRPWAQAAITDVTISGRPWLQKWPTSSNSVAPGPAYNGGGIRARLRSLSLSRNNAASDPSQWEYVPPQFSIHLLSYLLTVVRGIKVLSLDTLTFDNNMHSWVADSIPRLSDVTALTTLSISRCVSTTRGHLIDALFIFPFIEELSVSYPGPQDGVPMLADDAQVSAANVALELARRRVVPRILKLSLNSLDLERSEARIAALKDFIWFAHGQDNRSLSAVRLRARTWSEARHLGTFLSRGEFASPVTSLELDVSQMLFSPVDPFRTWAELGLGATENLRDIVLWLEIPPSYDRKLSPLGPEGLFDKVLHLHADLFESFASRWSEVREVTFRVSFPRAEIGNAFFAALGHRKRGPWRRFRNKFTRMGALQEVHFRFTVPRDFPDAQTLKRRLWDATGEVLGLTSRKKHGPLWRDKELSAAVTLERQGVTATVAAFGTSWYAQRSYQAKKEESKSPAAIPTWEYRMTSTQEHQPQSNSQEPLIHRTRGDSMEPVGPKDVTTPKDPAQPGTGQSATLSKVQQLQSFKDGN
ncbi:hypothetical protein DICSQDRAFT_128205 [Dichomitus squalens LYAD-421 SS1]|uniref:Uncharacterized protein n=1 Tax=Dichomitus squalens (strain LYAD-421) TaxID=732165 RepID=R7SUP9_DICSQ|nr:uncharacterized protein DICSQDRAFT_128205 [Dichomitus squalens LYAD-421 SS1]EJF59505.1 hypothetical protein DICSQDRAFT_128205 [Dichomitus squalens LYAD-421 SS1]